MSVVMGIDPSLTATGIVVLKNGEVVHQEVLKNRPSLLTIERVQDIYFQITEAVYRFTPQIIVIEGLSFSSRGQGVDAIFYLGWRIREELSLQVMPWIESPPSQVKKFATGKGNSGKEVVMKDVYKRWGYDTDDNNLADAYVMAQIGLAYLESEEGLTLFQQEVIDALQGKRKAKKPRKKKVSQDG